MGMPRACSSIEFYLQTIEIASSFRGAPVTRIRWHRGRMSVERDSGKLLRVDRIATLRQVLSEDPSNAFARYGLAMEYSSCGELDRALEQFAILLAANPDYTAGYFMAARALVKAERIDDARKMLAEGIAWAQRKGDAHAESEMQTMLEEIV